MVKVRTIADTTVSIPTVEGAGVHLRRAFGFHKPELYDPFLLFDDFRSDTPADYLKGFPWHPHRGIDTITYMLQGDVEHGDSLGNSGIISNGEVQWMTAGRGIIHQEMPKGDKDGRLHGFQLWLNLPAGEKMGPPRYRDIGAGEIPTARLADGVAIKIICGRIGDTVGPVTGIAAHPEYLDISLPAGCGYIHPTHTGHTAIAYVISGSGSFAPDSADCGNTSLLLFSDGEEVRVRASGQGLRFLFFAGIPLREPIVWRGPIVMNTEEEIVQAFLEYHNGTFLGRQ